jgi:hypothetical protein
VRDSNEPFAIDVELLDPIASALHQHAALPPTVSFAGRPGQSRRAT